ncbi:MAG: hypothetical protein ACP5H8_03090 [Candidatus Micrarchaeia archaeon]
MFSSSIRYKQLENGLARSYALAVKCVENNKPKQAAKVISIRNKLFNKMMLLAEEVIREKVVK